MELRSEPFTRHRRFRFPLWLGIIMVLLGISLYNRRDMFQGAAGTLQLDPTPTPNVIGWLAEARVYESQGRIRDALALYARVSALEQDDPETLVIQSRLHLLLDNVPQALEAAQAAVARDPEYVPGLNALARALDWAGEYEEAVDVAVEALTQEPDNSDTLAILGEVYADVGNWIRAQNYLDQALEANPLNVMAWRNQALLLERQGLYREALDALDRGLSVDPSAWYLEIHKGRLYEALLEWEEALAAYERAVELNPNTARTWDALGYGHFKVGNDLDALRTLKDAVAINPESGVAQAHLGTVYYRLRNYEQAVEVLNTALELLGDETRIEYLYQLGLAYIYKEPRECAKALPWLQKALDIDPNSGPALEGMAACPV